MKIQIDNGHGIDTAGKRSPDEVLKEWEYTRMIARLVVNRLADDGYDAELLVPENEDVTLSERVRRVNDCCEKRGPDNVVFVSIHCNAAGNREWMTARGWSAYTSKGNTRSDELATMMYEAAERNFADHRIRKDMSDGDADWEEDFYILRKTKCAAVLTENFFMDNKKDVSYMLSLEGQTNIVKTHVEALETYVEKYSQKVNATENAKAIIGYVIAAFIILMLMCSCKQTEYVAAECVSTDTEHTRHEKRDSVYVRDSIFVYMNGDTVREYRDRVMWRDRLVHDTVYIERTDSVPYRVEVEKPLTQWERTKIEAGGWAIGAICGGILLTLMKRRS